MAWFPKLPLRLNPLAPHSCLRIHPRRTFSPTESTFSGNKPNSYIPGLSSYELCKRTAMEGHGDQPSSDDIKERAKRFAAYRAVDEHVEHGQVIGIGSGSTIVYVVERLAERYHGENIRFLCVPTSFQAKGLILEHQLPLTDLNTNPNVDLTIDGCDQFDENMNLIKGGGGCLLQEKIVASAAKEFVVVADYSKKGQFLGEKWKNGVPLEVANTAYVHVLNKLDAILPSNCQAERVTELRLATKKAGPVVTDNGNLIIDFQIQDLLRPSGAFTPGMLEDKLKKIPGILETGLFIQMATAIYCGHYDGFVESIKKPPLHEGAVTP